MISRKASLHSFALSRIEEAISFLPLSAKYALTLENRFAGEVRRWSSLTHYPLISSSSTVVVTITPIIRHPPLLAEPQFWKKSQILDRLIQFGGDKHWASDGLLEVYVKKSDFCVVIHLSPETRDVSGAGQVGDPPHTRSNGAGMGHDLAGGRAGMSMKIVPVIIDGAGVDFKLCSSQTRSAPHHPAHIRLFW